MPSAICPRLPTCSKAWKKPRIINPFPLAEHEEERPRMSMSLPPRTLAPFSTGRKLAFSATGIGPAYLSESRKGSSQHKILVIDDEGSVRNYCCKILQAAGYTCAQATDGVEGLESIQ